MKRIAVFILAIMILIQGQAIYAKDESDLIKKRATAYCLQGVTASGEVVRPGVCASGDATLLGETIAMYQRLPDGTIGKLIGVYEVLDTGCSKHVIDVWFPNYALCKEYMQLVYADDCNGKVFIEIIEGPSDKNTQPQK